MAKKPKTKDLRSQIGKTFIGTIQGESSLYLVTGAGIVSLKKPEIVFLFDGTEVDESTDVNLEINVKV